MSTTLKYPYRWGQKIVEQFTERYARATDLTAKMACISHEKLCRYLILTVCLGNSIQWEALKRVIKSMDSLSIKDFRSLTHAERREYLTRVKWIMQDSILDDKILHKY